ncbi:uncharacterized protein LOC114530782 [Dendronephthya gigantea]|uniref:uncharacterized protein LOC114530782 n=1 Tax=Dendronephthya gigantea TaxID=151771 RepID=UPI0010691AE6|nr:uncharacterized protein LOC114530782 [Dendronephthya gigantea]
MDVTDGSTERATPGYPNSGTGALSGMDRIDWRCDDCLNMSAGFLLPLAESSRIPHGSTVVGVGASQASIQPTIIPSSTVDSELVDSEMVDLIVNLGNDSSTPPSSRESSAQNEDFGSYEIPPTVQEESIRDGAPGNIVPEDTIRVIEYEKIESSTQRGKCKLVDNLGHSYTVKRKYGEDNIVWRCTVRNKTTNCLATVRQHGTDFSPGVQVHSHQPSSGIGTAAKIISEVKAKAMEDFFRSAGAIADEVLVAHFTDAPCAAVPKVCNLARQANRKRQKTRPQEPTDLEFEVDERHIPDDFLQADVKVGGRRHLIFSTPEMIALLKQAKVWYMDATFKVVKDPFKQLFSIHAFVRQNSDVKQIPLAFILMSGKKRRDYKHVLKAIKNLLADGLCLKGVVIDFEHALWQAVAKVFPGASVQGCVFHWTQAIWRKVQGLGLTTAYNEDDSTHKYIRRLMALPFLPHEHISQMFEQLKALATTPVLQALVAYISDTWINSTVWSPENWSIFKKSVRTNNDVEGWHHRLNHNARRGSLPFYLLVDLLHRESRLVSVQVRLVSDNKLKRQQRRKYRKLQGRIFEHWDKFIAGEMTSKQLLHACAHVNGPCTQ